MHALDYIDDVDYQVAISQPLTARQHGTQLDLNAAYVAEMVRTEMLRRYGRDAYEAGFSVITTVDSRLQSAAKTAVLNGVVEYDQRHGYRGPEQQWKIPTQLDDVAKESLRKKLQDVGSVGPWHPALVLSIEDKRAVVMLARRALRTSSFDAAICLLRSVMCCSTSASRSGRRFERMPKKST